MKYVRFTVQGNAEYGILQGDMITVLDGSFLNGARPTSRVVPLKDVTLLPPTAPSKALCIGLNYRDHAEEMKLTLPASPVVFIKPSTCVIAQGESIKYPALSHRVDFEGELAIVIGKTAKDVPVESAKEYILGYSCANDVTARDLQPQDGQWTTAKSFDTFLPYGPVIETELNTADAAIQTTVNGAIKQSSNIKNLIFGVEYLVSYLSQIMTLLPGDIILTGTPSGIAGMNIGDEVCVSIEGIGHLVNTLA